ncbi:MAG: TolC family protein [Acetobacteraceae bacterium]|nr:TolC family protein [Acetobacteraceae bacterium]
MSLALVLSLLVAPTLALADTTAGIPGATLESVLSVVRRLSPDLASRALDTEAAQARTMMAASLPDPQIQVMSDDADRTTGPRLNRMIYSFQQDIPLWGRRSLRRDAAQAEVGQMQALARNADVELAERVKIAFARYYAAYQAVHRTEDLHKAMHGVADVARARYAQGRGEQAQVFRAEVDTTRVAMDIVRLEAELKTAQGQLNALLLRPANAPLAMPERLRPLPDVRALDVTRLLDRARQDNPALAADTATLSGAVANRKLADKTWYPDVTLGVGAIDRPGWGPRGYQAWVGVKIPLQWGLHEGEIRQAAAQAGAAQARIDAREQQIHGDLAEAVAGYEGSRRTADLIRKQMLPQTEALVRSGAAGYAVDKVDLESVLRSEHDLSDVRLQLLAAEFDSQRELAAIERLIGGDL